jgi:hypothetical protein
MFGKGKGIGPNKESTSKPEPISINQKVSDLVTGNKSTQSESSKETAQKTPIPESKTKSPAFQSQVIELAIPILEKRMLNPLSGKDLTELAERVGVKNKAMCRKVLRNFGLHPKERGSRTETISADAIRDAISKLVELKKEIK